MKNLFTLALILMVGNMQLFGQKVGEQAPDFEVNLQGGGTFKLSEQEGKVVFVFLFGNTCPSCVSAGSKIESSVYQAFKDSANFTAVGLDTWDSSSNETSVSGFKSRTGISFPLAIKAGSVASKYQSSYDHLMVIDQGRILVHKGILNAGRDINNVVDAITESLAITGVEEVSDSPQLKVYPNPVADVLHIDAGGKSISGISLFDITGKKVLDGVTSGQAGAFSMEISLEHLKPGVYFYLIQAEGTPFNGKILIQR